MAGAARVRSVQALGDARSALLRFAEESRGALNDLDADALKTLNWLQYDRVGYWQRQIKVRTEAAANARVAFHRKKLTSMKEDEQALEEWQVWQRAQRSLQVAEDKLARTRHWMRLFERELTLYRGAIHPMSDALQRDIPHAISRLERMVSALEGYARPARADELSSAAAPMPMAAEPAQLDRFAEYASWRRRAPGPELRAALAVNDAAFGGAGALALQAPPADLLTILGFAPATPADADKVVLAEGWSHGGDLLLSRAEPSAGDSGWYLAPATVATGGELTAVSIGALLTAAPSLARILDLPPGTLAVTAAGRLDAVLDASDLPVYRGDPAGEESRSP